MNNGVNPSYHLKSKKLFSAEELFLSLQKGDKSALATAITYIESNREEQNKIGREVLKKSFPFSGKSKRIGVTGVPGAGKSTFIESVGKTIVNNGGKLAVLAVDPSSSIHKGSILGDKTRMQDLSVLTNVFIRPTPSGNELGGVARNTFEAMILCEAAGYDHIFIETVGVGQSETEVKQLTDFFILLMITGAGDELQGIKRGIMEMADLIVVNKADGTNLEKAKKAAVEIKNAIHILGMNKIEKTVNVQVYSSIENTFQNEILNSIEQHFYGLNENNKLDDLRASQQLYLFQKSLKNSILQKIISSKNLSGIILNYEEKILQNNISAFEAVDKILSLI